MEALSHDQWFNNRHSFREMSNEDADFMASVYLIGQIEENVRSLTIMYV